MLDESAGAARGSSRCRAQRVRNASIAVLGACWAGLLGGCVANSSNPLVDIKSAQSNDSGAQIDLELSNPGGRHLTVRRLTYQVSHGEAMFPVANGEWVGEVDLPAGGHTTLSFNAPFETAPPEAGSRLLHLNGELFFRDRTGFLGLRFMDLTHTAFQDDVEATEKAP
jgi:hypothetical protein